MERPNRLYLILHPTVALIGSQLSPEELARHYTAGPTRHYRGKVIFADIDVAFRDPYFRIDEAMADLKPHEDGRPKATKFISSYRVLEFVRLDAFRALYLTTPEGYCLELRAADYPDRDEPEGPKIYAEIAPLRMLVLSRFSYRDFARFITDPANPVGAPQFFYTQVDIDLVAFLEEYERNPFMHPPIPSLHPSILRNAVRELEGAGYKSNKGLSLQSNVDDISYRMLTRGFMVASQRESRFYPMPPEAEIEKRNLKFWKSL